MHRYLKKKKKNNDKVGDDDDENNYLIYSRGLRPGSKVCSEHMNDWQYLSLGDQEQNEFFPKSKS